MQHQLPGDLSCSECLSHKPSLGKKGFGICDRLWIVLLFCGFSMSVCVHKGGISGPDNGNNPTGNWAALSKLHFSHLL